MQPASWPWRPRRQLRQRQRSFVWTSKILPDFRKFQSISVGDVRCAIVGRKPEMAQAKSGRCGAGLRRATPAHYSSSTGVRIQEDISMTVWTRIGIAAIAVLALSAAALAPVACAADRPLSAAQLKKINGWIADQGKDIAVSAIITEILGLTKNDQTISAHGYAALDTANGNEIHQIFILPEGKGYLADHFHQDKVEVYWADKDLVLLTALSGIRGAKPEIMFFQDAQAGFNSELTWWGRYVDKN